MSASKFSKSPASEPVSESTGVFDDEALTAARLAPLTGRDTEVGLLMDRWEQANEGMGQVVLLIGEPGLGKSRLVSTIKHLVRGDTVDSARDSPIIEWSCSQRFQNTGLYAASNFFERCLGLGRDQAPGDKFDRLARHL